MKADFSQDPAHLALLAEAIPGASFDAAMCRWIAFRDSGGVVCLVVAFYAFSEGNCEFSFATFQKITWTAGTLRTILGYPFYQLGLRRLTAVVHPANARSRQILQRLNFKLEGAAREWFSDAPGLIFGLTRGDCKCL